MLSAAEIREKFLKFFQDNHHTVVPSSSLIPADDPSLLFTNAGMVQFKKVFLGQEKRDYTRAVTSQKCLRVGGKHNDLENVGRTRRHHTFFEMLGNFSFGDYFKERAIDLAWTFLTRELGLERDKLFITIFADDDDAHGLWQEVAGVSPDRIYRLGEKDNFWSMGDTGPCGPCSEVLYDQGEGMSCGPDCAIGVCDCDRYLEIWNLVFMQYDRDQEGNLNPLPRPSIDTGMGLERISAVCQGVYSNYDTDLLKSLITDTARKSGKEYGRDRDDDVALAVIADHARSSAFMIADGILPSNEGRGYILRRLIRRAFRFGRHLGLAEPFLHQTVQVVVQDMSMAYPELEKGRDFMVRVIRQEEERFSETLEKGLVLLEEELKKLESLQVNTVPGETAFKLYDTYGFPLDIVNDIAEKRGFSVDEAGFQECMQDQRQRARAAWKGSGDAGLGEVLSSLEGELPQTSFVGYDRLQDQGEIVLLVDQEGRSREALSQGEKGWLVASRTPFYAESGGQVGDRGRIQAARGQAMVRDTQDQAAGVVAHEVEVSRGEVHKGDVVDLTVDEGRRVATARNHTATHLLHLALRRVLGEHVHQAGSLVDEKRLRFDFTHIQALTAEEMERIEEEVNAAILSDYQVQVRVMDYSQAVQEGAIALFGEKYTDKVRVVSVGNISMELCGGTHLDSTAQAGTFCLVSESAVGSGMRRIEALTGWDALNYWRGMRKSVTSLQETLKVAPDQLVDKVQALQEQMRELARENKALSQKISAEQGRDIASEKKMVGRVPLVARKVDVGDVEGLRSLMDDIRSKLDTGVAMLGTRNKGKPTLLLYVSKDLHENFTAPELIKEVAKEIKGGGGGRPDLAQAGGSDAQGLDRAIERLEEILAERMM
ncbi:alanyl-tRNA synthetase [Desulfonatronospira thiodismutans ASO3-1]|uniref:Alanine--tRNA ligase n=1 Tax=Desulfonatronospira thiodismutans ASO3-1 TaxID=555779 RepID=D6SNX2_9BACT|nr:alanine--tRNA ligase [Desulfonatronospira thiodismutans]EFI34448.1 alanyl-tRNA synthetase [Desulfonatronospira thiodismutans ASO3-1]